MSNDPVTQIFDQRDNPRYWLKGNDNSYPTEFKGYTPALPMQINLKNYNYTMKKPEVLLYSTDSGIKDVLNGGKTISHTISKIPNAAIRKVKYNFTISNTSGTAYTFNNVFELIYQVRLFINGVNIEIIDQQELFLGNMIRIRNTVKAPVLKKLCMGVSASAFVTTSIAATTGA